MSPVSSCLRVVASPKTIINQKRHTFYLLKNGEGLYATATTFLVAIENEKVMHSENSTDVQYDHVLECTIGCKSLTSITLSKEIGLHDMFKDVEINDHNVGIYKKFPLEEVLPERQWKMKITIPDRSNVYVYQIKYVLETEVYFTHHNGFACVIASKDEPWKAQKLKIISTIHSAEFITSDEERQGVANMRIAGQTKEPVYGDFKCSFDFLPKRAQATLHDHVANASDVLSHACLC